MAKSDTKALEAAATGDVTPADASTDNPAPQPFVATDADADALPLRPAVAAATRAALLAGRYVDHAALHSLELALVDVHHRLTQARPALVDSHAELLRRIEAIL